MVLSRTRNKKAHLTIDELFRRAPSSKRSESEDRELFLALKISQEEHVNEQKKLLEQYSLLGQKQFESVTPHISKRRRVTKIEPEEEEEEEDKVKDFIDDSDDDQWFQTVSIRPQPPVKKRQPKPRPKSKAKPKPNARLEQEEEEGQEGETLSKNKKTTPSKASTSSSNHKDTTSMIKQEKETDDMMLDIQDVDEWLHAKVEKPETSEIIEITDLDTYLNMYENDEPASINIDEEEEKEERRNEAQLIACPICQKLFKEGKDIQEHAAKCDNMISETDSDSDCDIIDLINPANNVISKQTEAVHDLPPHEQDEDDGYLSPLEGFTSVNDGQDEASNPFFKQLQQAFPKPRATSRPKKAAPSTRGAKRGGNRFRWHNKKRKKKS